MNKSKLLILLAAPMLLLSGCDDNEITEETEDISFDTAAIDAGRTGVSETFFQVPSPGEMLTFIKMVGGKNNKSIDFLNPPSNAKNYTDARSQALNFGIYSCDLSYCSIFEIGSEALKYFKTVKSMVDQIGVSTAIKPEVLQRLEKNFITPDE